MRRERVIVDGEVWCIGDWFRAVDTLHLDGRTFTGEIELIFDNGYGHVTVMFQNGSFPARSLAGAVRL